VRRTLLRHSKKLLEEAAKDLEIGCYNKAASASYFAVRKASETLLMILGEAVPRRDDKLANAIKYKGLTDISRDPENPLPGQERSRLRRGSN